MVMQSVAWAQGIGGGSASSTSSTILSLIPFALIFVIFYFLVILPQQKRAKQQKALAGGPEEGRQGGHGVGYLGHRDESREGDGDAADRRYYEDSDTTGPDCSITRRRRRG